MTRFRPCLDLHSGKVKQIVGGTLKEDSSDLKTNFTSEQPPSTFIDLYRNNDLIGGHVIMLGAGNEEAAMEALQKWPGKLQVGGGINADNAMKWIECGAEKVIVTSCLFPDAEFSVGRLQGISYAVGDDRNKLVIDLSCRRHFSRWFVTINKWQTLTNMQINKETIALLEPYCSEFLVHAVDNEGLQSGIDEELVAALSKWCKVPVTYAGGASSLDDLERVKSISNGRVDLTIGSALDIFGGQGVTLEECIAWNRSQEQGSEGNTGAKGKESESSQQE